MKYIVTFDSDQYPNEILLHSELMSAFGGSIHPIHVEPVSEDLLDQGITRLQLLSFLRGDDSDVWNGTPERTRWVRYRAHQITRVPTPDGHYIQIAYTDHDGTANDADWTIGGSDYDAYAVVRMVDFIIDAVIAEYGPDEILGGAA